MLSLVGAMLTRIEALVLLILVPRILWTVGSCKE